MNFSIVFFFFLPDSFASSWFPENILKVFRRASGCSDPQRDPPTGAPARPSVLEKKMGKVIKVSP